MSPAKKKISKQKEDISDSQSQLSMEFAFSPQRIRLILIFICSIYCIAAMRLFYIQIIKGGEYQEKARLQYEIVVQMIPQRGQIFDRNGRVIAMSVNGFSYALDAKMIKNKKAIITAFNQVTGDTTGYYERLIMNAKSSFTYIIRGMTSRHKIIDSIKDPGFIRLSEPKRRYVYGSAGAQVIGYANIDNIGVSGIELHLDSLLQGKKDSVAMKRDAVGNLYPTVEMSDKQIVKGHNVSLTLDIELQRIAEYELAEGIMESHAEGGTVIAIYPSTGEILAMASYPTFDPNHNNNILPEAMRLQGITDIYEPGSTFKLITACAMIEEGILKPDSKVDGMGGTYRIGNYEIKDSHPMYKMSFSEALEQSSNIVFAKNSDNLSSDKFYKYARDFGFGIFLGIDLPGEVSGILKKPSAFDASTKRFMAYGYELGATALQVVNAYATVANRGIMMRPYVIKSIIDNDGGTIMYNKPQRIRSVISNKTSMIVKDMLCGVVDRGTGQEAKIDGIRIAGKTGTAQQLIDGKYSKQAYTASFAGFFPADNPKIAMIVMLHRPKTDIYGGKTAAPIFRKIAQKWITASKLPINENLTDQELMQSKLIDSALVPDLRGISVEKAREMVHSIGLRLPRNAEGIIIEQYVPKGFWLKKGTDIPIKTGDASKKKTMILTDNSQKNIPGNQIRPNVKGMSVRRAMSVLHSAGYQVRVIGQGKVIGQVYNKAGKKECILSCE